MEGKEEEMEGVTEAVLSMLGIGGDDIFSCDILLPESSRRAFHISMGFLPYEQRLDNQSKGAKAEARLKRRSEAAPGNNEEAEAGARRLPTPPPLSEATPGSTASRPHVEGWPDSR